MPSSSVAETCRTTEIILTHLTPGNERLRLTTCTNGPPLVSSSIMYLSLRIVLMPIVPAGLNLRSNRASHSAVSSPYVARRFSPLVREVYHFKAILRSES